jgi:hypothetical protein
MYLSEDFGGGNTGFGRYHRLAEAIRRGCLLRPKKRCFQRGSDGADALGAAIASVGALGKRCTKRQIVKTFPELGQPVLHPVSGCRVTLAGVVISMNDYLDWPREDIADWLCRAGECKHEVKGGELPVRKGVAKDISGPSNFHNLAEAMRRGCVLRPRKAKGLWKSGITGLVL